MNAIQLRDQAHEALRQGDLPLARSRFQAAAQSQSADARLLCELGGSLWALYDFHAALAAYQRAAASDPQNSQPHLLAAQKLFSIARFQDCAHWLEQALPLNPNDPALLTMLGEVCDRNNRLADAERYARQALDLAPHAVKTVRLLAHLERRRGLLDRARIRLTRHLRQCPGPEDWRLRYELAAVLDRLGEYDAAMAELFAAKAQLEQIGRASCRERV